MRAWRWAFRLSALVAFLPSSCFRRCHSRCCFVRLRSLRAWGGRAPSMRRVRHRCDGSDCAMVTRGLAAFVARIARWPRRFLVRSSLVHDVLRVVLARVGLRRRLYEQGRKPETNEGLLE